MEHQITIREAATETDVARFWEQLYTYFKRDLFPNPNAEERSYFLGDEYQTAIQEIHDREMDRCCYLFFHRNGQEIGFAMPLIYTSEDGKCFIMEFCVYPEYRGNGAGKECAKALLRWAREHGAQYAELSYGSDARRLRFWNRVGFLKNGVNEWGEPLLLLPPEEELPFVVEVLRDPKDWQLLKLENSFKTDIGEDILTEAKKAQLQRAIQEGKITFFVAKRGTRMVGMCSVANCYSTFSCSDTGVFDDFYLEPAFRGKGVARMLAQAAQRWCNDNGIASLTVCCAPCDEAMYRALGFETTLGRTFAYSRANPL